MALAALAAITSSFREEKPASVPSTPRARRGRKAQETDGIETVRYDGDAESVSGEDERWSHKRNKSDGQSSSGGNESKRASGDSKDSRNTKKKQQNKIAQRCFRERKAEHVKNLESEVLALASSIKSQTSENENLRELLGLLQKDNLTLRQSAFASSISAQAQGRPSPIPINTTNSSSSPSNSLRDTDTSDSHVSSPFHNCYTKSGPFDSTSSSSTSSSDIQPIELAQLTSPSLYGSNKSGVPFPQPSVNQPPAPPSFQLLASNPSATCFQTPTFANDPMDFLSVPFPSSSSSNDPFDTQFDPSQFDDFFLDETIPSFTTPPNDQINYAPFPSTSNIPPLFGNPTPSHPSFGDATASTSTSFANPSPLPLPNSYSLQEVEYMLEKRISPAELQEEKRTGQWRQNSTEESNKVRSSVPVVPAASFGSGWRSPAPVVEERNPRLAPWGEGNGEKFFAGRIWVAADPEASNVKLDDVWLRILDGLGSNLESLDLGGLCDQVDSRVRCDGKAVVLAEAHVQQLLEEIHYLKKPSC
ncbi:hypothetical protein BDY24DRAFT_379711 [Mrakia frigida]|uniref:bZIP transcription factor n=1 Tax=Mrakia frigida TaxID=29902 RepID=UPI003FCBF562